MDENEAESERDKQAALAGNDRNGNGNFRPPWRWGSPFVSALRSLTFGMLLYQNPVVTVEITHCLKTSSDVGAVEGGQGSRRPRRRPFGKSADVMGGSGPPESVRLCLQ